MIAIVVLAVVGVVAILIGNAISRRNIRSTFGSIDAVSIQMSEGTGVVPRSVSFLVLAGWLALVVSGIVIVVAAIA